MIVRIDDIGASTKQYNQHGKKLFTLYGFPVFFFPFSHFWFFKRICPFRAWGPYEELSDQEWREFLGIFKKNNIRPIIAITACWVDERSNLIPFPKKFPSEALLLKNASDHGDILIANHGLSHCVIGKHLPLFWKSNRKFHREFWPDLDEKVHKEHISRSQEILEDYFEKPIEIFIPPGNVWSKKTYDAMRNTHIKKVISSRYMLDSDVPMEGIEFIEDTKHFNLHDRDLKLFGATWLVTQINARTIK